MSWYIQDRAPLWTIRILSSKHTRTHTLLHTHVTQVRYNIFSETYSCLHFSAEYISMWNIFTSLQDLNSVENNIFSTENNIFSETHSCLHFSAECISMRNVLTCLQDFNSVENNIFSSLVENNIFSTDKNMFSETSSCLHFSAEYIHAYLCGMYLRLYRM